MKIPLSDYFQLLRHYLAPQRGAVWLMAVLLFASTGLQLAGPQVVRWFIDAVQQGAEEAALWWAALLFLVVALLRQMMHLFANYWSERVAWSATNALRADLAEHLIKLDLSFHKAHTPGELIERVDGDVNELAGFFSRFTVELLGSALLLVGVLVSVYTVDLRLGLAFTLFAGLTLLLFGWVWQGGAIHWQKERECSANFYGYIGEVLTATEDIRASAAIGYALRRFFEHLQSWLPVARRAGFWGQSVMNAAILAIAVGEAVAYWFGGRLYLSQVVSLGAVYLVLAYMAMLGAPLETIRLQLQELQRADASILRVRELLDIQSKLEPGESTLPAGALSVKFNNVHFHYDDETDKELLEAVGTDEGRPEAQNQPLSAFISVQEKAAILNGLSFQLQPGKVLGILGRTGSGKSTIARLLFRLYDPQQGEVRLGDVDLRQASLPAIRQRVGLVTQDVQLFAASLRHNLTFFDSAIPDQRLVEVLTTLGLQEWLQRQPNGLDTLITSSQLSAGEAQLLALARLFLKDPGLIILDEASSRLDPATETLLERALDRLLAGRTVVIIAHRLATLERADDILILEQGRIVEYGARCTLAAEPTSRFATLRKIGIAGNGDGHLATPPTVQTLQRSYV